MILKRKLSPNERMYLAFEKNYNSFVINRVIEGEGKIDLKLFQEAVNKVAESYPESSYKLKNNMWLDSKLSPKIIEIS